VLALRFPLSTAVTVAASLAQIGEFSFILAGLGISFGLLTGEGRDLILAGALISITLNRPAFTLAEMVQRRISTAEFKASAWGRYGAAAFETLQTALHVVQERHEQREQERAAREREVIERFPLFAAVEPEKREEFFLLFKPRDAAPGDRIIRKGDKADGMYFISSGSAEVDVNGRKFPLGPGQFFGEMALLSGARRNADVTATDYVKLLVMAVRDFQQFMARDPKLRAELDRLAAERSALNRQAAVDPSNSETPPAGAPAPTSATAES